MDVKTSPQSRRERGASQRKLDNSAYLRALCASAVKITTAASILAGCATPEPWVKPYERERLADPIMKPQRDLLAGKSHEHIRVVREAARGATGVQGGGCGCN